MNSLTPALACDLLVVAGCIFALVKLGELRHSHPAVIYLFFHIYTVTLRGWSVSYGAATLFTTWQGNFDPVSPEEISRAIFMADAALSAMTLAWFLLGRRAKRTRDQLHQRPVSMLAPPRIWTVVAIAFPIGCVGLYLLAKLPGGDTSVLALGEWEESSWLSITQTWPGLCLLALIYWYGFRWWLVSPMGLYLLIMSYQGYHRFRVVIPAIMMIQMYLDRRGKKWPGLALVSTLSALGLMFLPLKSIGRMAQEGLSATDIAANSAAIVEEAFSSETEDHAFLDQMASTVTLVDDRGKFYWGEPYLALVTLPMPRQWWPQKPGLADYMDDFSTRSRPMKETGMITTVVGEGYANFGYAGVVLIPFALAWFVGALFHRAYSAGYFAIAHFAYLMLACNLIQVFRDGVVSMVVFTAVNMMPLTLILMLHKLLPSRASVPPSYGPAGTAVATS